MTVPFTLCTLVVLLVVIISTSYFMNKEGFENITNASLANALNTVSPKDASMAPIPNLQNTPSSPKREEIVPEVAVSGSALNALTLQQRMDLLKDIQKVVRNEILANRRTQPVMNNETNFEETNSTAQGKEYEKSCDKESEYRCPKNPDDSCPPVPDMSQYIKKDAIPCYGCAIDY